MRCRSHAANTSPTSATTTSGGRAISPPRTRPSCEPARIWWPRHAYTPAATPWYPGDHGIFSERHVPVALFLSAVFDAASRGTRQAHAGGWSPPEQAQVAVDVDFVRRCAETGASIVATGEFTTFKFNAAWRRNVYRRQDVDEQRAFVARMRSEGEAFRSTELARALQAAFEDRLLRIEIGPDMLGPATAFSEINHLFKGTRRPRVLPVPVEVEGRRRYPVPEGFCGFEWHAIEQHRSQGAFRWSGPGTNSCVVLPERPDRPLEITVLILAAINYAVFMSIRLAVNEPDRSGTRSRPRQYLAAARLDPPRTAPRRRPRRAAPASQRRAHVATARPQHQPGSPLAWHRRRLGRGRCGRGRRRTRSARALSGCPARPRATTCRRSRTSAVSSSRGCA